ncbi:MAG: SBBP repeat-containing protein [Candidatus Doudnabacteria bacterium]|nr:SBBP repeat-containing protein [Candidatus Doudnabacteria bacterium]
MKQRSSIKGPVVSSRTYVRKTSKSLKRVLFRRAWLGFLTLTLIVTSIAGVIWNPQHNIALADTVAYGFVKQIGGTGSDQGASLKLDGDGNIYSTGAFSGTVDFDPGAGTSNLVSAGLTDIYISKLDSNGDFVWAKKIGGTGSERSNSIVVDSSGNSYITGKFEGTVDFDPGVGTTNLVAGSFYDIFITKLDVDGNFVWAKSFAGGGNGFYDEGKFVTLDNDNNVYSTGTFDGTTDFDPGAGTANLSSTGGLGNRDVYISKLDVSGNYVWAKAFVGASDTDTGRSIVFDASNNVYSTGTFRGQVDFDPGAGTATLTSSGSNDIFVSKLDSSGVYVWAANMGGTSADYGNDIQLGNDGNLYISGPMGGNGDFDPGVGTTTLLSADGGIYVSVLDSSGNYVSATNFGAGASYATAMRMAMDSDDNIYITGYFGGTADFDPGSGTTNLISAGGPYDMFLAKYDSDINLLWAKSFGSAAGNDYSYDVTLDSSDVIYYTGGFTNTVDFDPGSDTSNLVSAGSDDAFVSKLTQVLSPTVTTSVASEINAEQATLSGNITSTGGADATERGFEYGLTNSYGSTLSQVSGPYSTGAFSGQISDLACSSVYYFRSYATNPGGTSYGSETNFTTSNCTSSGSSSNASQSNTKGSTVTPETPTTPPIFTIPNTNPGTNPPGGQIRSKEALLPPSLLFTRNLGPGSVGADVQRLQQFMNANGYSVSTSGAGALNQETTFFGARTRAAVRVFQEAFASEILTPLGLTQGTGYFGNSTRALLNSLIR